MMEQVKLTEKQVEEYAIAILKDRDLFEVLMLFSGITHDQAEATNDEKLMRDSDKIFNCAHQLETEEKKF